MKIFLTIFSCLWMSAMTASAQETAKPTSETPIESAAEENASTPDAKEGTVEGEGDQETKEPEKPPAPLPFILRPYEVKIFFTISSDPAFTNGTDARIADDLKQRLQALFRQMWNLEIEVNNPRFRFTSPELNLLSDEALNVEIAHSKPPAESVITSAEKKEEPLPDTINNRLLALQQDKVFFATLDESSGEYQVSVREWDASSRTLSSVHHLSTFERRTISGIATDAVTAAFRPIAEVEVIDGDKVEYLIRAGELFPRDPAVTQFKVGDYLTPFMRYMNRKREVQRITNIPWTYLRVEEITRSRMRLSMTSAFRSPIPLSRRRVEVMGMRIKPHLAETTIRIYPRGNKLNPLVGVRCEVMERLPTKDNPVENRVLITTDREGTVRVAVNPEHPLQFIVVYSGNSTLAQVPFIPGDQPFLEVEVPDDSARLTVEGEVALLQSELIDIIATREVLFARARGAAKKKDWGKVDGFIKELEGLQTFDQYQTRIETLRVQAVYAAQLAKDRVAESRIKKLCDGILDSAKTHLDPFRIAEFRREMSDQRRDS